MAETYQPDPDPETEREREHLENRERIRQLEAEVRELEERLEGKPEEDTPIAYAAAFLHARAERLDIAPWPEPPNVFASKLDLIRTRIDDHLMSITAGRQIDVVVLGDLIDLFARYAGHLAARCSEPTPPRMPEFSRRPVVNLRGDPAIDLRGDPSVQLNDLTKRIQHELGTALHAFRETVNVGLPVDAPPATVGRDDGAH